MTVSHIEEERDVRVRAVACPNCHVPPRTLCDWGRGKAGALIRNPCSHTGRYIVAMELGLVPHFVGAWRWMS